MPIVREYTDKILMAVDEGLLDRDTVIMACLKYMSEADVKDMAHINEFFTEEEEDEETEEEEDGEDTDWAHDRHNDDDVQFDP